MRKRANGRIARWLQASLSGAVLALPGSAEPVRGQPVVDLSLGYAGARVPPDEWSPGYGPSVALSVGWDRTQFRFDYGFQARDGGTIAGYCTFFGCVDGPFDESFFLHVLRFGVARSALRSEDVDLAAVVRGGRFIQGRHLTRLDTREEFDRARTTDLGMGVGVEARVTRWSRSLAPRVWLAYDRVFETLCPADGTCYRARNRYELGLGVSWRR
jgi:hypothetical protein